MSRPGRQADSMQISLSCRTETHRVTSNRFAATYRVAPSVRAGFGVDLPPEASPEGFAHLALERFQLRPLGKNGDIRVDDSEARGSDFVIDRAEKHLTVRVLPPGVVVRKRLANVAPCHRAQHGIDERV